MQPYMTLSADVLIVGGGSAGVMAAIRAKQMDPGQRVVVFEKGDMQYSGRRIMVSIARSTSRQISGLRISPAWSLVICFLSCRFSLTETGMPLSRSVESEPAS